MTGKFGGDGNEVLLIAELEYHLNSRMWSRKVDMTMNVCSKPQEVLYCRMKLEKLDIISLSIMVCVCSFKVPLYTKVANAKCIITAENSCG